MNKITHVNNSNTPNALKTDFPLPKKDSKNLKNRVLSFHNVFKKKKKLSYLSQ